VTHSRTSGEHPGGLVDAVEANSLAAAAGLLPGDVITHVSNQRLNDAVDFKYLISDESIELTVLRGDEQLIIPIEKEPDEDLGVSFAEATFDGIRTCNNKCFFCFLKGLPKGLRKPLYVKDDDYRLSFAHGNFVTLTNLTDEDWQRLEEQRLSPLRLSVHATDLDLRRRLLGNPKAPDVLEQIDRLSELGIRVHTQVVLCPGVNDGQALDQTIADLSASYPTVQTVSIVPVGATTAFDERAPSTDGMEACNPEYARQVVRQVSRHQRRLRRALGEPLVYLADELYLTAAARLPGARHYDGYEQFENGIGMTRWLIEDWKRARTRITRGARQSAPLQTRRIAVGCGTLIAPTLQDIFGQMDELLNTGTRMRPVRNNMFGPRVNASGLIGGNDFSEQLAGADCDAVFISRYALDWSGERFLDDVMAVELQQQLGKPVAFVSSMSEVIELLFDPGFLHRPLTVGSGPNQAGKSWNYHVDPDGHVMMAAKGEAQVTGRRT
jgi:putative radical SAM enzyme (TIGR03279 family)